MFRVHIFDKAKNGTEQFGFAKHNTDTNLLMLNIFVSRKIDISCTLLAENNFKILFLQVQAHSEHLGSIRLSCTFFTESILAFISLSQSANILSG